MAKLSDLLAGKELIKVKVRRAYWFNFIPEAYFQPVYQLKDAYYGHNHIGIPERFSDEIDHDWEIYEPEKPKVTRIVYWFKLDNGAVWMSRPCANEDELFQHHGPKEKMEWFEPVYERECPS